MLQAIFESGVDLVLRVARALALTAALAAVFWIIWVHLGIGPKYFSFLPTVYHQINFWDTIGIFVILDILKSVVLPSLIITTGKSER